jgi:hypothetical protein
MVTEVASRTTGEADLAKVLGPSSARGLAAEVSAQLPTDGREIIRLFGGKSMGERKRCASRM